MPSSDNKHIGSTLDDLLAGDGTLAAATDQAVERVATYERERAETTVPKNTWAAVLDLLAERAASLDSIPSYLLVALLLTEEPTPEAFGQYQSAVESLPGDRRTAYITGSLAEARLYVKRLSNFVQVLERLELAHPSKNTTNAS